MRGRAIKKRTKKLTPREAEVLLWVARGKTNAEISVILRISQETVKAHIENARIKLGASNKTQAVALAIAREILNARDFTGKHKASFKTIPQKGDCLECP